MKDFRAMVDKYKKDFIPNPLDDYDTYTYSLELFVVNQEAARKFMKQEASLAKLIANDGWPIAGGENDTATQYVTIAKTGYTTEFNITNLTVDSVGVGNSNHSKVAGTADKLEFTITQVGNTSLSDTMQTAIALCGYKSIADGIYFIKINFLGELANGVEQSKLPQTKVLPFKIRNYNNVSTSTDARGTTTVLTGQVAADDAVMNKFVATMEFQFNYKLEREDGSAMTVTEGLNSYFTNLAISIKDGYKYLDPGLKNDYSFVLSKQFKDAFGDSLIDSKGIKHGMEGIGKNNAIAVGEVLPMQSIYSTLEEIILSSPAVQKELTKDNAGYTKVLKITPQLVLKLNGFNTIKGTQAYEIEYFIDYQKRIVEQNMTDFFVKIKNNRANCEDIFKNGYVHKKYDYLFTGNNDQILNFEISLQAELVKTYLEPSDSWKNMDFIKETGFNPDQKELIRLQTIKKNEATKIFEQHNKDMEIKRKALQNHANNSRDKILEAISGNKKLRGENFEEKYGSMTFEELLTEFKIVEPSAADSNRYNRGKGRFIAGENAQKMKQDQAVIKKQIKELQAKLDTSFTNNADEIKELKELNETFRANNIQKMHMEAITSVVNGYESTTDSIFEKLRAKNTPGIILAEELGDDYITTMSNNSFRAILTAQRENPIQFERLVFADVEGNMTTSVAGEDKKTIQNAKAKYYEAKMGELSMFYAEMTIKGDPFFIEGYMPPKTKKQIYKNGGTPVDTSFAPVNTFLNGFPHIVLESGKASGTDDNDNIIKDSMILSLYAVKSITSSFSNGIFTQNLSLVKNASAENFIEIIEDPIIVEKFGVGIDRDQGFINDEFSRFQPEDGNNDTEIGGSGLASEADNGGVFDSIGTMVGNAWNYMFGPNTEKATEILVENSEEITVDTTTTLGPLAVVNPTGDLGKHELIGADNIVRRNLAYDFVNSSGALSKSCTSGSQKSCLQLEKSENDLLATIGIAPEDKGKATTVTAVNDYFNGVIADPTTKAGFVLSEHEVAAYQMAVGGELDITGHDKTRIQRIVTKATGEKTPVLILEQLDAGTYNKVSTDTKIEPTVDVILGASVDNTILSGKNPLINEEVVELLVNIPVYTWEEQKYNDQINYPNSNNDWKNTHWFKSQVDAQVAASKVEEKKFNPDTRKLEIKKIPKNTLTVEESADVKALSDAIAQQINDVTVMGPADVTSDDVAEEWYANSSGALAAKMLQNGISLDEVARVTLENAQKETIVTATRIDTLSDESWAKVQAYADGINKINENAHSGVRGDLTEAKKTQTLGENLTKLSADQSALKEKTTGYYFDQIRRDADKLKLEEIEIAIAKDALLLPAETITAVRTVVAAGNTEYIQVKNPVEQLPHTQLPILVMPKGLNTVEVHLPSARGTEELVKNVTNNEVSQLDEARKVYKLITSMEYHTDTIEVNDDFMNEKVVVKDYNNLPSITYKDANGDNKTIANPSAYFGLYTNTYDDSNPAFLADYDDLKTKISELFPSITSGVANANMGNTTNGTLQISIRAAQFYIDQTE